MNNFNINLVESKEDDDGSIARRQSIARGENINVSPWEDGLECIASLLAPASATSVTMTDSQRDGLKNLRAMLLLGVHHTTNHVPRALLNASSTCSSDFLLSEYAGYTRPSVTDNIRVILSARKCAKKIGILARGSLLRRLNTTDIGNEVMKIPAHWATLNEKSKLRLRDLLSWENLSQWSFNIFDVYEVLNRKHVLVFVAWAILAAPQAQHSMDLACSQFSDQDSEIKDIAGMEGYNFLPSLNIKEVTLVEFLYAIENRYNSDVLYHNEVHAADVTQSLHSFLQMGGEEFAGEKWELFSLLIAAIVHDVGHCGLTSSFYINSKSELALLYNDTSVLENMHAATAFRMIMGDNREKKYDIFENFHEQEICEIRKFIINAILSTDMTKHFSKKNLIKGILMTTEDGKITPSCTITNDSNLRHEVLSFLIHLADVSNPSKDIRIATQWTDKLIKEWYRQGEKEQEMGLPFSQGCDRTAQTREQSQIGFISFIVLPAFKLLAKMLPRVEEEIVPQIEKNLEWWKEQESLTTKSDLLENIDTL